MYPIGYSDASRALFVACSDSINFTDNLLTNAVDMIDIQDCRVSPLDWKKLSEVYYGKKHSLENIQDGRVHFSNIDNNVNKLNLIAINSINMIILTKMSINLFKCCYK